jgi:hypothetical protein
MNPAKLQENSSGAMIAPPFTCLYNVMVFNDPGNMSMEDYPDG